MRAALSLLVVLLSLITGCTNRAPVRPAGPPLFVAGNWSGAIWIPESPDFEEFVAAEELADWCARVTGRRPEVRREDGTPIRAGIALGRTQLAEKLGITVPARLGDRAVRRTSGDVLVLLGNSPVATRQAAGRFCEQALGITFVLPDAAGADYLPLATVTCPPDEDWNPAFAWRAVSGLSNAQAIAWARLNGYGERPRCTHGVANVFTPDLQARLPGLFASTPERTGPRSGGRAANPDFSHPEAASLAAAWARRWLAANPAEYAVPLGINDSVVYPAVSAAWPGARVVDGRPDRSDYVFGFLNRVAALDWNPAGDRALGALAYLDTQAPPSFPLAPAIFPAVCADRIQYANPDYAREEAARLMRWGASGVRHLGTWDYWFGKDVPFPRFHLGALAASIHAAAAAGVDSWYAELDPLWIFDAPKAWIGSRLLADPALDADSLADHWYEAAYGPAAAPMRELQAGVDQCWERMVRARLPGQWLLGWRDGAFCAEDAEGLLGARGDALLASARAALDTASTDARHVRMRYRLRQFELAWAAVRAQHERTRQARLAIRSEGESQVALAALLAAERAREDALAAFNAGRWPGQDPLRWEDFPEPNPWPCVIAAHQPLAPGASAAARVAWAAAHLSASSASRGLPVVAQGWSEWVAPPGRLVVDANGVTAIAPQGALRRRVTVAPGEIVSIRVRVGDEPPFRGNGATLTVRFPSAPPREKTRVEQLHPSAPPPASRALARTIRLVEGINVLQVPVGSTDGAEAEVEISFVDRLPPIGLVEIDRLRR